MSEHHRSAEADVPWGVRLAASWTWRAAVIAAGGYGLLWLLATLRVMVIPVLVAVLLAALLHPVVAAVSRRGLSPFAGAAIALLGALAFVLGLATLAGQQIVAGFAQLQDDALRGIEQVQAWLTDGPLGITSAQLSGLLEQAQASAGENSQQILTGALQFTTTAGQIITGFFICLFALFFFLADGERIWTWCVALLPRGARAPADGAGRRAWMTLIGYVRATVIVALVDGFGIGLGAFLLGVPLALPLGVLVFLGAFVPIVGALVTGVVAVLVGLVAQGPLVALGMLGVVLVVQQVESQVLQPFLLGKAVSVHPLAVALAVTAGVLLAGIVGALFAVPVIAVANTVALYLAGWSRPLEAARPASAEQPVDATAGASALGEDDVRQLRGALDGRHARQEAEASRRSNPHLQAGARDAAAVVVAPGRDRGEDAGEP